MPKLVNEAERTPDHLKPYTFHGISLEEQGNEAVADCPFCRKEGKFSVNVETGQWQCFVCGSHGNATTFINKLWEVSDEKTTDYSELAVDRKLEQETLIYWGVVRSITTGHWLVPGYGIDGKLRTLYQYKPDFGRPGKRILFPTPTLHHQLHGVNLWDAAKPVAYLLEGPWDGMSLWESLRSCKREGTVLVPTASEQTSLLARANVLAFPGCGSIGEPFKHWIPLLEDKAIGLMADSDHPRLHCTPCKKTFSRIKNERCPQCRGELTGPEVVPAGFNATKRIVSLLAEATPKTREVQWLKWGEEGYDPTLTDGHDVRDLLTSNGDRRAALAELLRKVTPVPVEWSNGHSVGKKGTTGEHLDCLTCTTYEDALNQLKKSGFRVTDWIDVTLSVMLACVVSTNQVGDQLWLKVIGPASCGKSTLAEAISTAKKYVFANSVMTRIHSGWKTDKDGTEDHSLIPKINKKTLIIKDVDPLLQAANKDIILAELRDLYDRVSRVHYGHGISRAYEYINLTIIFCGTSAIRALDRSELGARFLDVVMVEDNDPELDDEIGWRVINRVHRELPITSGPGGGDSEEEGGESLRAKQMIGGYVSYLRENAGPLLAQIHFPVAHMKLCQKLAEFGELMRARPSMMQSENAEVGKPYRLISQLGRLAQCLAVVLNKTSVDVEVMRRVRKVAFDTARGQVLELVKHLYKSGKDGSYVSGLAQVTGENDSTLKDLLKFLGQVGVTEQFEVSKFRLADGREIKSDMRPKFRLTEKMMVLYPIALGETLY